MRHRPPVSPTVPIGAPVTEDSGLDAVTGAFSYSGRAIADRLLGATRRVRTLTGHPGRAPAGTPIETRLLDFTDPAGLEASLQGVTTLYNTYWVRFAHGKVDHDLAVANSGALFSAAARAGVQRIVHVSITHPDPQSPYPYFKGKGMVEEALARSGVSFGIVRPAILFGGDGVLINNIAWLLRHLPVFAVGGDGQYRVRPMHVEDLAQRCLEKGSERHDSVTDAVGPDRPTFNELVAAVREAVGARSAIVHVPGRLLVGLSRVLGRALGDVLLTREEYETMAAGMADTTGPATGSTSLFAWLDDHASELGRKYANELKRHFDVAGSASGR